MLNILEFCSSVKKQLWEAWCKFHLDFNFSIHVLIVPWTLLLGPFGKAARERLLAVFMENYTPLPQTHRIRAELFAGLKRKPGQRLRLLEIGAGVGSSIPYFPEGTDLIVVDPNSSFMEPLKKNLLKHSDIRLIKHSLSVGEDMRDIETESIDVVVTSCVHCSVSDTHQVLSEIRRVLVPGGKYYFAEHCFEPETSLCYYVQRVLAWTNIWSFYFSGCTFKDVEKEFQNSGVFKGEIDARIGHHDDLNGPTFTKLVAPIYYGTATKTSS